MAKLLEIAPALIARIENVNALALSDNLIYTVPAGKKLVFHSVAVRIPLVDTYVSDGSHGLSQVPGDVALLSLGDISGMDVVDRAYIFPFNTAFPILDSLTPLYFNVVSVAIATAYQYSVDIFGYLVDA